MRNMITVGSKIGYLNPQNGKYKWVSVEGFTDSGFKMKEKIIQGDKIFYNSYEEKTENVIKFLKTPSKDFKDGRPLLKYKGTTKLY